MGQARLLPCARRRFSQARRSQRRAFVFSTHQPKETTMSKKLIVLLRKYELQQYRNGK